MKKNMKKLSIYLIKLYKKIPGSWHYNCRFYPTCSAYAIEALQKKGALKGSWLTIKRLLKCHPFHPGGYDPVE